jgi:predicted enzyme related to lactoylglutathione lyase
LGVRIGRTITGDNDMANPVIWFEVLGKDAEKLRGFYGEMFGWKFNGAKDPNMDYGMIDAISPGIGGGVGKAPQGNGWVTFYAQVPDLKASVAQAEKLGGKVLMPITELPEVTLAVVTDPEGHPVGLVKG